MQGSPELKNVKRVQVTLTRPNESYDIIVGADLIDSIGEFIRRQLGASARQIVVVSNERVFDLYGRRLVKSVTSQKFRVSQNLVAEGEPSKSMQ